MPMSNRDDRVINVSTIAPRDDLGCQATYSENFVAFESPDLGLFPRKISFLAGVGVPFQEINVSISSDILRISQLRVPVYSKFSIRYVYLCSRLLMSWLNRCHLSFL